ncbi:hypothetical protein T4A_775 [Trichinella pseudospiralis]|uniref:ZSWIM3 N-terminal domain-containing protein n=1 Tax=Trichinella pseudospiralis TaxID=6337 RepID=A0A0V1ERI0_TRIPS|nr:hypothetical protein T4E_10561 [Trichinella pseudospiralis]KRY76376.1 hypothetical protein T4A_775 [Trichinella pseudospiralis]
MQYFSFTVLNIVKMDEVQDEKSFTSENMSCDQLTVQPNSISEERSILLSQAAIMDVVENLRSSNRQDEVQRLAARPSWPNISGFQVGRRFKSFSEFEQAFDAWKSKHFHPFRVASSETLRLKDGSVDPIFRYRYIVYHCAHYGVPRVRGLFRHRKYNYLPCGCSAMLRLNYSWSEHTLRITTLHEEHKGHAVSAQAYKEFLEKSKRFGVRQNLANATRRLSAPVPSTAFANCQTLEAILNCNDDSHSDKENDSTAAESAAEDSMSEFNGVDINEGKVEPSSLPRTDEERFQNIHVVLQSLCDDLLETEDAQLDEKLAQLSALHSQWQAANL